MIPAVVACLLGQTNDATIPTSRLAETWWAARHSECVDLSMIRHRLAFLGDSITQRWETVGASTWPAWNAVNFGFNGDRTQHVLWRITNGELIRSRPDLVVILVGTNNLGHGTVSPANAAEGIRAIVQTIRQRTPATKCLLLTLIPRGKSASDAIRKESDALSKSIKSMANGYSVFAFDIAPIFLNANGSLRADRLMPDFVHPNPDGYAALALSLNSKVAQLLAR